MLARGVGLERSEVSGAADVDGVPGPTASQRAPVLFGIAMAPPRAAVVLDDRIPDGEQEQATGITDGRVAAVWSVTRCGPAPCAASSPTSCSGSRATWG